MEKPRKRVPGPPDDHGQSGDLSREEQLEFFRELQQAIGKSLKDLRRTKKLKGRFRKKGKP